MIVSRQIRERRRIGLPAARRETRPARRESGASGSVSPSSAASATNPIPALRRLHDAAQRRKAARVEKPRGDAVGGDHQVLDQRLGAVRPFRRARRAACRRRTRPRPRSVSNSSAPCSCRASFERLRDAVLHAQLLVHARHRRGRPAAAARRRPATRRRCCRRAWPCCGRARRRRPTTRSAAVRRDDELDDDRQTILAVVQATSDRSTAASGSIGKITAGV